MISILTTFHSIDTWQENKSKKKKKVRRDWIYHLNSAPPLIRKAEGITVQRMIQSYHLLPANQLLCKEIRSLVFVFLFFFSFWAFLFVLDSVLFFLYFGDYSRVFFFSFFLCVFTLEIRFVIGLIHFWRYFKRVYDCACNIFAECVVVSESVPCGDTFAIRVRSISKWLTSSYIEVGK